MKNILILLVLSVIPLWSTAQLGTEGCEIMVGAGRISVMDIIYAAAYNRDATNTVRVYHPIFAASYKRTFSDNVLVGIGIAQHSYSGSWDNTYNNAHVSGYYDALSLCADVKGIYTPKQLRYFQLYCSGSLGMICLFNTGELYPSLYFSPLGIRVGGQHAAYVEFGLGYKGLINAGYSLRLPKHNSKK